jgi:hypothetical protein
MGPVQKSQTTSITLSLPAITDPLSRDRAGFARISLDAFNQPGVAESKILAKENLRQNPYAAFLQIIGYGFICCGF